ncbi:nucleosidase [Corynebacterium sp. 335C]
MITQTRLLSPVRPDAPLLVVATEVEARHLGDDLPVLLTGIGKVRAAMGLAETLAAGPLPASVLNVGTAGALHDGLTGVHRVGTVAMHDFSHDAVRRITGDTAYPPIELGEGVRLATGDSFIEDGLTRGRLAAEADLCDMEGYAVAFVARRFGVPVELVKIVSDSADEAAGSRWTEAAASCSRILAEHIR